MERTILVVTGLPGAGKSEVFSYIISKRIPAFKTGDVIREAVLKKGLPLTIKNSEMMARKIREEHGMDVAARRTGEKIRNLKDRIICVEGPRDMHEIRYLASLGRLVILAVDAPLETRYRRSVSRSGGGLEPKTRDPKDLEEFKWRDCKERERGLDELMSTSEFAIQLVDNTGTREELHEKVDRILKNIK